MHASNEDEHIGTEQQRSPNEYQANERFNHRLMQCVPNVILFLSPDHQILEFNPEAERLYGRKREDVLGKDYFEEFLPDDAREAVAADLEKVLAGEPTKGFDNVVIAHDGQEHLLSWNVDRVLDSENKPTGIVAVGQDITEREKADETLQKSEEKYRTLFESANDVIFALEVNENSLCFKECNSRVIDMFRCRREDIIGKSPVDFSPSVQPDGRLSTERAAQLSAAAMAGEPQHFEWKHCRLDGTEFDAEVTLNRVDIAGEAYLQAIVRDITERKEAEEALRGQRDRAENYLNVAGVMFAHIDTEGKVTLINEKGCDILGYQEEEIVGKNWFDNFLPERNREAVKEVFFKLIAGKIEPVEYYENPILTKDGEERIIAWHNTILREEGKITGTLSSGEDISERQKAEEALQESENRYRSVVENAGEGIVISQDGILKFINPHFIDITGYSEEEFKSRPFIEFVHPDDRERVMGIYMKRLKGEEVPPVYEFRAIHKQGNTMWLENNGILIEWDGKPASLNFVRDITGRKKAEAALAASEQRFRKFFENEPEYCYMVSPQGTIVEANHAALNTLGYTTEELVGKPLTTIYAPESHQRMHQLITQWEETGEIRDEEMVILAKNGERRTVLLSAAKVLDEDGKPLHSISIQRDITERKQAEEAMKRSSIIIDSTTDAVVTTDVAGNITFWNKGAEIIYGYRKEEIIGQPISILYKDEDLNVSGSMIKDLLEGKIIPAIEATCIGKNQKDIEILLSLMTIKDKDGNVTELVGITKDITEYKRAEEELKESEKRYRLLVESASDSIFLLAMEGGFIDANPAACDGLGRTREELLTLSVSDIDPDWPSEKLKNFLRELTTGKPETIEGTYCRKNKTSFPVEILLTKVDVDERQVVLALARDITQRRRIEESLRRKAEIVSHEDKAHVSGIDIEWDHENGICTFEKLPVLMMWRDTTLAALMSGVQTMVGAERFGLALQAEGRKSVEDDWRVISQFPDFNKGFEAIANIGAVAGWGDWQLIELDTENKECVFRILNSWEGLYQKALGVNWGSGMLAGKLAGYCSMLFKDNCWADQTAFVAKGDDFDEFRVHTSERSVEKEIENLLSTDKATRADMAVALQNLRTEIAMRQDVEQALRESEQHYRAIVEDQTELICRNLSDGTITFVNEAYCRYFVKNRDELIGQKFMPLIPEEDHEKVNEHFASVGPDNPVVTYEHRAVMPNGEIRWHQWTNHAILDDTGKVIEYQGVGRDITKQKLAEKELKENEKRFRSLSEAAFEGIAITERGLVVDVNDAVLRMYGYSLEELRGKQVIDLVAPEDRELVQQRIHSDYEGVYEHKGIRKDGSLIDLEVQGRNVEYQGRTMRLTAIRDITERKQAERRIQEYQAQLKSLASELLLAEERERRRIATGIHDDIAQKLAMAKFSLQTLQASIKDADVSVSLEKQCELMSQIVADARSLTFELGNPVLYQVGLEAAVESYLTERIQEEFGIECKFLSEGPPSSLDEDIKVVLFQSVRELLANVVKHANASTIEVDVLNAEDKLRIVVKDDGVGFDPTEIGPHAMGRGGFGLFNIRERLEFFGGNLEIESRPKSGTRVTMILAVRADAVTE